MGQLELNHQINSNSAFSRLLICGLGSIGRRHARIFKSILPGLELSAYRSGRGKDCPELGLMTNIFPDLLTAISWSPDAAVIASPAPFHQQQALLLARHGIPLLIEKPIGTGTENYREWDELVGISRSLPIAIGYVLRHDPCALYVRERIKNNELGTILDADFYCGSWLPDWRPDVDYREGVSSRRSLGGGALLELSHEIDLAYWFFGDLQITYACLQQSELLDIDVEDQALLTARSDMCPLITIRLNFCTSPARRIIVIRCEQGELEWNLLEARVIIRLRGRISHEYHAEQHLDDRYRFQAESFISSVSVGCHPHCSLQEGLQVMKLINQARLKHYHLNTK